MKLLPIDIDETKNARFSNLQECEEVMKMLPIYYQKVGFHTPWIGYFATLDGKKMVGSAGFKGKPKDGKIEIAYGTFEKFEGQGIGTEICRQLVALALQEDPSVRITARTLMENNASVQILKRNGFTCLGSVYDEEDGEVWEWELLQKSG